MHTSHTNGLYPEHSRVHHTHASVEEWRGEAVSERGGRREGKGVEGGGRGEEGYVVSGRGGGRRGGGEGQKKVIS